ncbi:MAG TPA: acetolactate synthase large subunit [Xanthomonadales bacterium]|nr:acetolactate synthase large subunit [Xanthomonadales bacterium]
MNGAGNLLNTLVASGVDVCFTNPGTSEMQLVSAIGNCQDMRAILCLFEGVAAGAADGYGRMSDKPALTLLHVGSGFANSMANQHNAMRAHVPLVNLVGDHATWHLQYDSPLTSDVAAHARISSGWVRVSESADDLAAAGALAVQASLQGAGQIATLIAPANHAWEKASAIQPPLPRPEPAKVTQQALEAICGLLANGKTTALCLGGRALREDSLLEAGRIVAKTGARILCETFPARLQRGAGRVKVERLPYFAEQVAESLRGLEQLILVGAKAPVSFFAYPGKPSWLTPETCAVHSLAMVDQDLHAALESVARILGAAKSPALTPRAPVGAIPSGVLTPLAMGQSLSALMPENVIVSDESNTCGPVLFPLTEHAQPHDWLTLTGGAIGQGLPLALGAAIACPQRKVIALQADGSAMYTLQALWTMAREQADVTVVILNNRSYAILNIELARVGAERPTPKTLSMLSLAHPDLNWVDISLGMGVPATRATTAEEFHAQFAAAMSTKGPRLIEAMVVQQMPG